MANQHWRRAIAKAAASFVTAGVLVPSLGIAQDSGMMTVPAGLSQTTPEDAGPIQYLRFPHFAIPFDLDRSGRTPSEVHLWVSADAGRSWLKVSSATPDKRNFEFHAAAEGEYLFAVQTRDDRGDSTLAAAPAMRVVIDTSKPALQLAADVSPSGRLMVDYRIQETYLAEDSVRLAYSTDGGVRWEELPSGQLERSGDWWLGHCELDMPRAHEIDFRLMASDLAQNSAQERTRFAAPRTASAGSGLQLASQRADQREGETSSRRTSPREPEERLAATAGGIVWNPAWSRPVQQSSAPTRNQQPNFVGSVPPGRMVSSVPAGQGASGPAAALPPLASSTKTDLPSDSAFLEPLSGAAARGPLAGPGSGYEELPLPAAIEATSPSATPAVDQRRNQFGAPSLSSLDNPSGRGQLGEQLGDSLSDTKGPWDASGPSQQDAKSPAAGQPDGAYHSRSRSFSLDYAIDSLRGMSLSDVELWGTEDRGRTWQKWGSDPDRQSPFDVQVASDGLFGFRMVIIGSNGLVSNRPQDGDAADMWIYVDTEIPTARITRALYGEGDQAGMLVIDYNCADGNLHDRPVTLSYSERPDGPWVTIEGGLRNTGTYLWKANPGLPPQVYLRIEAVDLGGNTGEHRLELPVNLGGLAPRGRIQGFRPIDPK